MRWMWSLLTTWAGIALAFTLLADSTDARAEELHRPSPQAWARIIDQELDRRLQTAGVPTSPAADDTEFLRRVYLDLHGTVPPLERTLAFLNDSAPEKRSRLIEELLASPRFGEYLADIWAGYLKPQGLNIQRLEPERLARWLADGFHSDTWDRIVFDLLTASGRPDENPAVIYLIQGREPITVTEMTDLASRYFLGVQFNCAQCHDHPFTSLKQDEYWGMASFFVQIQNRDRRRMLHLHGVVDEWPVDLRPLEEYEYLKSARPTFPGGTPLDTTSDEPYRRSFARWLTSPENPYFARAMANRMWWHFFGRGLVNPVDDMHEANPPSHPELLDLLAEQFVASGFDLRFLCLAICNSRAYQRSSRPVAGNEQDDTLFSRMPVKVLTPEQMYDSLMTVVGPPMRVQGLNARFGARHEFVNFFKTDGEPEPTRYDRGIPHLLRLMNSPQFQARGGRSALLDRLLADTRSREEAIERLYLAVLSRRPTPDEQELIRDHFDQPGVGFREACGELLWALLLSSEFSLNR